MQEDNDLFVSADENEEELPTVQPGEPTAEESSSALSSASASSFSNPFGAPSQNIFSQESQKQTPSLFSTGGKQESPPIFGGSQAQAPTAMSAASSSFAAAPPSAPFNPFSAQVNKASSPFESSISATANQQASAFPPKSNFSSLFAPPKDSNATTNPFQAKSPEPTNNIFTNSNFKFPSTTTSAAAPLIPPFQAPSVPASTDASSSVKTTGETSASSQKPLFNFSAPKPTFSASAPGEQPSPFSQTQGPPRGPENSISNGSLFDRASTIPPSHIRQLAVILTHIRPVFWS